ncbi:MAG: response regulator [Endomicrobiales bacterium]
MQVVEKVPEIMQESVLVIDDEDTLRTSVSRILEKMGFKVNSAETGLEGLKKIKEKFYDMVILDIRMPEMDGIEFLRNMRKFQDGQDSVGSFVIITTGYASENVPVEALKLGAVDYIRKPFELTYFEHSIEQNLKLLRAENMKRKYTKELAEKNAELKIALDKLTAMQEELMSSERFKIATRMASYMGHSLRNPLTTIKNVEYMFKNMLKRDTVDIQKFNELVELLSRGSEGADEILTNLLNFSDDIELHLNTAVNLSELIDAAFGDSAQKPSAILIKDISPQSKEICVDNEKMKLVFTNLFKNALLPDNKASAITVVSSKSGNVVKISVADNGAGFNPSALQHVFEPVFDNSSMEMGYALPLARSIIEKHNGKIEVHSTVGKGSTFTVTLPAKD